jgi:RNA polymerase sigma-70 factor (ECF subfamily)
MSVSQELIDRCANKERKAQIELYKKCYGLLLSICSRYERSKDEAEELLNQAFLKILNNIHKFDKKAPFEAWIRRIMINTIIDNYRKNKKEKENLQYSPLDADYKEVVISYNEAFLKFETGELERMLQSLPETTKTVIKLFAIEGYSQKEIGDMLDLSEGTSKWHLSIARKKLKELIDEKLRIWRNEQINE